MKVERRVKIETDRYEVGDQIKVKFINEKHKATAIRRDADGMLFLLDDCLDEIMFMNEDRSNDGGYDASDLRKHLAQKANELPDKLKTKMVAFENGDYLRLLSLQEALGVDTNFNVIDGQIEWMKDRRNRVASRKDNEYAFWWLCDAVFSTKFALITYSGDAAYRNAGDFLGVRPAFKIRDL